MVGEDEIQNSTGNKLEALAFNNAEGYKNDRLKLHVSRRESGSHLAP